MKNFYNKDEITSAFGTLASSIDMTKVPEHQIPIQVRDELITMNQFGYMKFELDEFSKDFIDYAKSIKNIVLEIGPAYGWLVHQVLKQDIEIIASDISKEHLEVLLKNAPKDKLDKLHLYHGAFPGEIKFPSMSLGAVLASRVFHFFDGKIIEEGLNKIYNWLVPNGMFVCINCSIYHSSVKGRMHQIFKQRIEAGEEWAGMTLKKDFDSVHDEYSQPFLNTFYKEQLEELLPKHGFKIEKIKYFDYPSDPWPDEGKGHIGFVATKV